MVYATLERVQALEVQVARNEKRTNEDFRHLAKDVGEIKETLKVHTKILGEHSKRFDGIDTQLKEIKDLLVATK